WAVSSAAGVPPGSVAVVSPPQAVSPKVAVAAISSPRPLVRALFLFTSPAGGCGGRARWVRGGRSAAPTDGRRSVGDRAREVEAEPEGPVVAGGVDVGRHVLPDPLGLRLDGVHVEREADGQAALGLGEPRRDREGREVADPEA